MASCSQMQESTHDMHHKPCEHGTYHPTAADRTRRVASRLTTLVLALLPLLWTSPASTQETQTTEVSCVAGTGSWHTLAKEGKVEGYELRGALCGAQDLACPDFTTLRFAPDGSKTEVRLAQTPKHLHSCNLTWQGQIGALSLYHDGAKLIGVNGQSLQVSWTFKLAQPMAVSYQGDLLVLQNSKQLLIFDADKEGNPKALINQSLKAPIEVRWLPDRLLVVEKSGMRWWPLDKQGHPKRSKSVNRRFEHSGNKYTISKPELFTVDPTGLLLAQTKDRRVLFFPFKPDQASNLTVYYGTESIRQVGGAPNAVTVLTYEQGSKTRLIGMIYGNRLRRPNTGASLERYETGWVIPEEDAYPGKGPKPRTLMAGAGVYLILDGGRKAKRAQIIDITEPTWRFRKTLNYDSEGAFVATTPDYVITAHEAGPQALIVWGLPDASRKVEISRAKFQNASLKDIDTFEALGNNTYLIRDSAGHLARFDAVKGLLTALTLEQPSGATLNAPRQLPSGLMVVEASAKAGKASKTLHWHLFDADNNAITLRPKGQRRDAFDVRTRWFGYCPPKGQCTLSVPSFARATGNDQVLIKDLSFVEGLTRPLALHLVLIVVSIGLLIALIFWRLDVGKTATHRLQQSSALPDRLIATDVVIDGEREVSNFRPDSSVIGLDPERATLTLRDDDVLVLNTPRAETIELKVGDISMVKLTRQADFAGLSEAGLLTLNLGTPAGTNIQFDIMLPSRLRGVERITYMTSPQGLRVTWDAFELMLERLGKYENLEDELYRRPVRSARLGEAPIKKPDEIQGDRAIDDKGRRYISDQDHHTFVNPGWRRWFIRTPICLVIAIIASLPWSYFFIKTEPSTTALVVLLSLALPPFVLAWTILSWGGWNRLHLLRFGNAVEGRWVGPDSTKLHYTLIDGRTFEMRRNPFQRPDLVPVVLYDPKRPSFAAHFTGHRSLDVLPAAPFGDVKGRSQSANLRRLLLTILVMAAPIAASWQVFKQTFPEPVPEGQLRSLVKDAKESGTPMLGPCLELCPSFEGDDQNACVDQCQQRQFTDILKEGGIDLKSDPTSNPHTLRLAQVTALENLMSEIKRADANVACDTLAKKVASTPRWSTQMETAFATIYVSEGKATALMTSDPKLIEADAALRTLQSEFFVPLCEPSQACQGQVQQCPTPPACTGSVATLQEAICSLAPAARPLAAAP